LHDATDIYKWVPWQDSQVHDHVLQGFDYHDSSDLQDWRRLSRVTNRDGAGTALSTLDYDYTKDGLI